MKKIFDILDIIEKEGIKTINIENDIFTYLFNTPTIISNIQIDNCHNNDKLYTIPRDGDILINISIKGDFEYAELYQYNWTGLEKIIYDKLEKNGIMNPFPYSGFPLLQMGKILYLNIHQKIPSKMIINATYAFLENTSRIKLFQYKSIDNTNGISGVKIIHKNKDIFQVIGIENFNYSLNYLEKIT